MLKQIWLVQPLAFARGGSSPTPCDAFDWAPADLTHNGSGRTQVVPADTLIVDPETGDVSMKAASHFDEVIFKDGDHIRPVCPFFELHGAWEHRGEIREGPLTPDVLAASGLAATDLRWRVEFHNAKAYHWTKQAGDRIVAIAEIAGNHTQPVELRGTSSGGDHPLVPAGKHIPFGFVQLTRPNADFPEFRLRFHPGSGKAWGPANLNERLAKLMIPRPGDEKPADMVDFIWQMLLLNAQWADFRLPPEQCILDPQASWPNYSLFTEADVGPAVIGAIDDLVTIAALAGDPSQLLRFLLGGSGDGWDVRNLPPGLYARITEHVEGDMAASRQFASLGLVDDFGDGVISCTIAGIGTATARIVSGPPDFAPDRRPPVSLADGLADRMLRAEVRSPAWVSGDNADVTDLEIQELVARAFETMGLANIDATNDYFTIENLNRSWRLRGPQENFEETSQLLWTDKTPLSAEPRANMFIPEDKDWQDPLPITTVGRDAHRRNMVSMLFRSLVLKYPDFMDTWIREPAGPDRDYDRKMPGLMRGGDRMPLTLTRRQYDLLSNWVESLRRPPA